MQIRVQLRKGETFHILECRSQIGASFYDHVRSQNVANSLTGAMKKVKPG